MSSLRSDLHDGGRTLALFFPTLTSQPKEDNIFLDSEGIFVIRFKTSKF